MKMHYKFLDTLDINKILVDNTIVIGTLSYYRRLEGDWIGDRREGSSELIVKQDLVATENSSGLDMLNRANIGLGIFKMFVDVSNGGRIDMPAGTRFVHQVRDCFIYSASFGKLDLPTEVMCIKSERPYNACLKIRSMHRLEHRIFERGRVRELSRPVSEVFDRRQGQFGAVQYESLSRNIEDGPVISPSAFKKDLRFKAQAESRITFIPTRNIDNDRLIIELSCAALFDEVFRDFAPGQQFPAT
jgi:hypothetical protein